MHLKLHPKPFNLKFLIGNAVLNFLSVECCSRVKKKLSKLKVKHKKVSHNDDDDNTIITQWRSNLMLYDRTKKSSNFGENP